jgi:UDP-N-acetylmuramate dehydrogenase
MYKLIPNFSLRDNNSFGLDIRADYWLTLYGPEDWKAATEACPHLLEEDKLILGGGTNMLFLSDFDGLVISPLNYGFNVIHEDHQTVDIEVGAGEDWDDFVEWSVDRNLYGAENLSLIPGKVGAAPVQNIGAYGVEAESLIIKVNGFDLETCTPGTFTADQCNFSYRSSIFKEPELNRFLITSVVFRLKKQGNLVTSYGDLKNAMQEFGEPSLSNLRKAVIKLRGSKLPDPKKLGNAGSFFKNPIVSEEIAAALAELLPGMPVYQSSEGYVKIGAGFLIEKAGWKGFRHCGAAVHDRQALVIVNTGKASGHDILKLAEMVRKDVYEKFGVMLEPEVRVIRN